MKDRVFLFVVFALMFTISSGAAYDHPHRSATTMSEAWICCGDPLCPPPPTACQPPQVQSQR